MDWKSVRNHYPDQWLVVEAEEAHTDPTCKRTIDRLSVVEQCPDGAAAFSSYRAHHSAHPDREYYFVHTSRSALVVEEEKWLGVRISNES